MLKSKVFAVFCFLLVCVGVTFGAPVILNEYNAVDSDQYLGINGSDSYWDRVAGNGGDWFELVVIQDHLDMRGWKFDIYVDSVFDETIRLMGHSIWSDLRSGTIITISEDLPDDISYEPIYDPLDPTAGDWWINVQAKIGASGQYVEDTNFPVNNNNWQLRIKTVANTPMFGPCGEGVDPNGPAIGGDEIFRLEEDPSASITPFSNYDDAKNLSTFGAPNRWGNSIQDFSQLRSVVPEPATVMLLGLGSLVLLRKRRCK
jgi:hypothetical protein